MQESDLAPLQGGMDVAKAECEANVASQQWEIKEASPGVVFLTDAGSGKSLRAQAGAKNGDALSLSGYGDGGDVFHFTILDAGDGRVELESVKNPGFCVSLTETLVGLLPCGSTGETLLELHSATAPDISRVADPGRCLDDPVLPVVASSASTIGALGTPYDPTEADTGKGPKQAYCSHPAITALAAEQGLDVFFQDEEDGRGLVVHLAEKGADFEVTAAFEVGLLDSFMGFAAGEGGMLYYATGVREKPTLDDPPVGPHRPDVVRVGGFDAEGCVRFEVDVDLARGWAEWNSPRLINPMFGSTSALAYGDGALELLHGNASDPDNDGTRHQKSQATFIETTSGLVTRTGSQWVGHSLDQRLYFNDGHFLAIETGDTYPRAMSLAGVTPSGGRAGYKLYHPPGSGNQTYTRLGGIAPVASGEFGYFLALAVDRAPAIPDPWVPQMDLALVRIARDFWDTPTTESIVDEGAMTSVFSTTDGTTAHDNHLPWLTDGTTDGSSVVRPRIVAVGADEFVVLWERWSAAATYEGFYGARLDVDGEMTAGPALLGTDRIPRGDDAIRYGHEALLVSGDQTERALLLTFVDRDLNVRRITVE